MVQAFIQPDTLKYEISWKLNFFVNLIDRDVLKVSWAQQEYSEMTQPVAGA